jgi:diguanylate cyclase (GGDEF)-like protein
MEKPFALIVEDDRRTAALFRHVIDLVGFQSEAVFHGQVALERLAHSQPDLVLLDLNLPGIPGNQILDFIRKTERLGHTKVVVISGQAHVVDGLSAQPDLVLLKPVSVDQLTGLISRITLSEQSPKAIPIQEKPLDSSTNLYNQAFFKNRLESVLKQSREIDGYLFSVFLFKLEPRGNTKNHRGTESWEATLREVAGSLRSILRPTDTIARFDPDTFYILIENIPGGEVSVQIANRIQEILYRRITDIETKIRVPIRVGILLGGRGYQKVDVVLSDAKYALALASAQGEEYAQFYYQVSARGR